jgi:hypothetical protein
VVVAANGSRRLPDNQTDARLPHDARMRTSASKGCAARTGTPVGLASGLHGARISGRISGALGIPKLPEGIDPRVL